ncbi:MAG: carbon-nitrogen hydrolase family protein [Planctomycetota bacterium]|nr:MAG: carbon-nitrogen hydrolase family protein [Planctomycetota bacterium]
MKLALIQQHATRDRAENLARGLAAATAAIRDGAQVLCFAELAFEPFHPAEPAPADVSAWAEPIPGPTSDALCQLARRHGVVVIPNLFERDGDATFDTSPVIDADGSLLGKTRMLHVPDYACFHERGYYTPGDRGLPVFETAHGKLGVAICYDRHFPEAMRALALAGAELVLVPQAGAVDEWPDGLYEAELRVAAFQDVAPRRLASRARRRYTRRMSGHVFHPGHDDYHGLTVVLYTSGSQTVIGRWDARVGEQVRILNCCRHEQGVGDESRDDWVARTKKFGVPNDHAQLLVPGDSIERVVHLVDA